MLQLRFVITLCLSISLVLGQLFCVKCTYASPTFNETDSFKARQRRGKADSSTINLDSPIDVEAANRQLLQTQFREENKKKFDQSIRYGMAGLTLLASYMLLWNMAHTPQTLSATRPYEHEDFKRIYNQQRSFTNSGAFSTLQFFIVVAALGAMIRSVYTLWQVKDTLPSSKELKIKSKAVSLDASLTLLHGVATLIKVIPASYNKVKTVVHNGPEVATFRPSRESTKADNFSGWSQVYEDFLHVLGVREMPLISQFFKLEPATEELKQYKTHPPETFKAQYVTFDASNLRFNPKDLAFLLSLKNFDAILLKNSQLEDPQVNLIKTFSSSLEVLDIRKNPKITLQSLLDNVVWAIAPQNLRGIMGFGKVRKVLFDAREDVICETGLLLGLAFPERRRIRVWGELTIKEELTELFNRQFYYFNQATPASPLPKSLVEILEKNTHKRSLQDSYIEKGYLARPEIKYKRSHHSFNTIREVMNHINTHCLKNVFYLIEYDEQNKPVLYVSDPQLPQQPEDTLPISASEPGLKSFKPKFYRITIDRIFGQFFNKFKTFEESIQYLEEDILLANSRGAYLIEYDSTGKQVFYGAHNLFQYHDQTDVWFTPTTIFLPKAFKDYFDPRLYLRDLLRIYKTANPDKLMPNEAKDISSFIKIAKREGMIMLASELKHLDKHHYSVEKLEKDGFLTEVRLIEALTRCGFLKSLLLEVLDNSRY